MMPGATTPDFGAIARRYHVNQYGITSSPLQGGLPSDRLVAEWWLRSNRVESLLRATRKPEFETLKAISVPAEIYGWKAAPATREPGLAFVRPGQRPRLPGFGHGITVSVMTLKYGRVL